MPGDLSLGLTILAFMLFGTAALVLSWPFIVKAIRSAHLVWPRERLYARCPSLRRMEHESGCRAWARDMEVSEFDAPNAYHVVRVRCRRCKATHDQNYIPREHPDYGVRCPADD